MTGDSKRREERGSDLHVPRLVWGMAALAWAAVSPPDSAEAQERREFRELHMGMEVRIVLFARNDLEARTAARRAFDRIATLEDVFSDYRPASELRRLEARAGEKVRVSRELFDVLWTAREMARRTNGVFDPTAGPLTRMWREARLHGRLPAIASIDSAHRLVGWTRIELDSADRSAQLASVGMQLDLGGVAKGYILASALETLRTLGAGGALIEAGGDLALGDAPPGESGWTVAAPHGDSAVRHRAASLSNVFVATSGPGAQSVTIDGKRYSHVIDARTGMPLARWEHATVIATDGMVADALATALTLVAPERRAALVEAYRTHVVVWSVVDR
jgi:thiamine biosynthesis lipoprotein